MLDPVRTAVPERLGRFASRRIGLRGAVPPGVRPPRRGVAHDLVQDVRYAVRTLGRTPALSAVAVAILALGIGANTTIFTVVDALFFDAPPGVVEPERLVRVYRSAEYTQSGSLAYPDYEHYRDNNAVFTNMLAYDSRGVALTAGLSGLDNPGSFLDRSKDPFSSAVIETGAVQMRSAVNPVSVVILAALSGSD